MNILQKSSETHFSKEELFLASNYNQCPTHQNRKLQFLSTDPSSKYKLKCVDCLAQSSNRHFIPLLTLLDGDKKTIFRNWPVINDEQIYDQLIQISQRNSFKQEAQNQIQAFFKEFRVIIDQKLENKQLEMMKYTEDFYDINDKIFNQYNQLSAKEELIDIILNKKDDFEKQNLILNEIVQRVSQSQDSLKKSLLESISHINQKHDIITFDTANKIKQNVIQQINNIDLFVIKNLEDIQMFDPQEQVEVIKQNISRMKIEDMTTSQLIIKLINNQLNNCSNEILNQLTQIILSIQNFLNKQQIHVSQIKEETFPFEKLSSLQIQKVKNLHYLTEKQTEEILCLITELKLKNENNNSTIQDLQRIQNEDNLALNKFIELFSNKSNNCKKLFIENCKSATQKFSECINSIYLKDKNIFKERQNPINFENLEDKQLKDIEILVSKISQLSNQYGINYKQRQNPQFLQQNNSFQIQNQLKKCFQNENITQQISQLLVDYPIFELLNQQIKFSQKNIIEFIHSDLLTSKSFELKKEMEGNLQIFKKDNITGQIITKNSLDLNTNYIFRVKTNLNFDGFFHIALGILESQKSYNENLKEDNLCFYSFSNKHGLDIIEKGKNLFEERKQIQTIEVRINISKRILQFSDFPNYSHINSCKSEKIQQTLDYNFCIFIGGLKGNFILDVEIITDVDQNKFQAFN
ncbi:hypothetical protein ABPG74_006843 [Tetrahymena malaccensis]